MLRKNTLSAGYAIVSVVSFPVLVIFELALSGDDESFRQSFGKSGFLFIPGGYELSTVICDDLGRSVRKSLEPHSAVCYSSCYRKI